MTTQQRTEIFNSCLNQLVIDFSNRVPNREINRFLDAQSWAEFELVSFNFNYMGLSEYLKNKCNTVSELLSLFNDVSNLFPENDGLLIVAFPTNNTNVLPIFYLGHLNLLTIDQINGIINILGLQVQELTSTLAILTQ